MNNYLDSITADPSEAQAFRAQCRSSTFQSPTSGHCMSFVQTNVVFLPKTYTKDFLIFCQRNPKPCPLLEVSENSEASILAPGSDLYRDLPKYTLVENGTVSKTLPSIEEYRDRGLDVFLLGCSFSFEQALIEEGIPIRHIEQGKNVSMFITNIPCRPAGVFKGQLVVSMRPIPKDLVRKAANISARFPAVHGAPVHIGDPVQIGIKDLGIVDFGDPVEVLQGDVPVFWACGVTPLQAIVQSGIDFAITHSPGHMFITDKRNQDLDVQKINFSIV